MSAFSTVGDVFTDEEFSAPGNSLLWGLGALDEPNRECAGFSHHAKATLRVACPFTWMLQVRQCAAWLGTSRPICSSSGIPSSSQYQSA